MATEDFGINDPNLLQLIESGINNPAAVAALLRMMEGQHSFQACAVVKMLLLRASWRC